MPVYSTSYMGSHLGTALSILIIVFSSFGYALSDRYFRHEKTAGFMRYTILLLGISTILWGFGYGLIGFTDNAIALIVLRKIALAGVVLYLVTEVNIFVYNAGLPKWVWRFARFFYLFLGYAEWFIFSDKKCVDFVYVKDWTTWTCNLCWQRTFHNFFLLFMASSCIFYGLIWRHNARWKRDKALAVGYILSNLAMLIFTIPDSFAVMSHQVAIPTSALGGCLTLYIFIMQALRSNSFSISQENLFQYTNENLRIGIMVYDPEFRLDRENAFAESFHSDISLKGKKLTEIFVIEGDSDEVMEKIKRDGSGSFRCTPTHNPNRHLSISATLLSDHYGEIIGLITSVYDITKEDALIQEAEDANRAKTLFLASVSHEIRSPINVILGMNEVTLRESKDPDTLECARNIDDAGHILLSQINEILDSAKMDAGKLELVPGPYRLHEVIKFYQSVGDLQTRNKNLMFALNYDDSLPDRLTGDEFRIKQIITNLFSNAVKYTDHGCVFMTFSGTMTDSQTALLKIEVKDTGMGIKEEDIPHLFTNFSRMDLEKNKAIQGTGLGLAIVKQLCEMMGGEVSIASEYGVGSTFTVTIPQELTEPEHEILTVGEAFLRSDSDTAETAAEYHAKGKQILIADDIPMNLKVVQRLLGRTGLEIETAPNGKVAYHMATQKHYDLIFLDHRMPEMDGLQTLKALKEDKSHPNQDTKLVVLTANASDQDKEKYLREGFDDYLSKPVSYASLTNVLRKYIAADEEPASASNPAADSGSVLTSVPAASSDSASVSAAGPDSASPDSTALSGNIFTRLPFLTPAVTLANCMNDMDFVMEVLTAYVQDERYDMIQEAYDSKDWTNYEVLVHGVKGVSRTIGAVELGEEAYALELAEKRNDIDFIHEHHEAFMEHYSQALEQIRKEV